MNSIPLKFNSIVWKIDPSSDIDLAIESLSNVKFSDEESKKMLNNLNTQNESEVTRSDKR